MTCYFRSKPVDDEGKSIRGYRQWMKKEWEEHGVFEITEQRLCDQARAIRKKGWLSNLELDNIRRMIDAESVMVNDSIEDVEENQTEEDMVGKIEGNEQITDDLDDSVRNADKK